MPPQVTYASALTGKTGKYEFSLCIATIQPVAAWFLQSFWLTTHTHAALWLPKSYNQCIQLAAVGGGMVQEKGSQECRSSWTALHAQYTSALSSGFPLSQTNAEALDRWGRITKHSLISYFLSNTSAKSYRDRIMYVKIIGSQRWDVFMSTPLSRSNNIRGEMSDRQ